VIKLKKSEESKMNEQEIEKEEPEIENNKPSCENCNQTYGSESKLERLAIFRFLDVYCHWCGKKAYMEEFHHSAIMHHLYNKVEFKGEYILTCPNCNKEMTMEVNVTKRSNRIYDKKTKAIHKFYKIPWLLKLRIFIIKITKL
jgi:hypothetical protein